MALGAIRTRFGAVNTVSIHCLIHIDRRLAIVVHCLIVVMAACAGFFVCRIVSVISAGSLVVDIVAFQALRVISPVHVEDIMFIGIRTRPFHSRVNGMAFGAVGF